MTPPAATFPLSDLARAIRNGELFLHYQPQVTPDGQRILGVEALVRWAHPTLGSVPPSHIVAAVESAGLIKEMGLWVLSQACHDAQLWPGLYIGINVSPQQFRGGGFAADALSVINRSGVPPERVELEVTESAYFDDVERAEVELNWLRSSGIKIALDDFGTGYSSLTYLRRLPFDKLKIDKSFVDDLHTVGSASIIQALVAMCRALGIKVTAEGVETKEQQRFLKSCGCHALQGFLFSRPVEAKMITTMLRDGTEPRVHEMTESRPDDAAASASRIE